MPNLERVFQGQRLIEIRESRGLSQVEVAAQTGLTNRTIINAEKNRGNPAPDTILRLKNFFNVPDTFFFGPLSPPLVDDVREDVVNAWASEAKGDFWKASDQYSAALAQAKDQPLVRYLKARLELNSDFAEQVRQLHSAPKEEQVEIPAYDDQGSPIGSFPRKHVHYLGLLHHTVILLFRRFDGAVAYYTRHEEETFPNCLDFFGGHCHSGEDGRTTAIREANEEFGIYADKDKIAWDFDPRPIGGEFSFPENLDKYGVKDMNVEKSTVYSIDLPSHPFLDVRVCDEDASGEKVLRMPPDCIGFESLETLAGWYSDGTRKFADGAARVLRAYCRQEELAQHLKSRFSSQPSGSNHALKGGPK